MPVSPLPSVCFIKSVRAPVGALARVCLRNSGSVLVAVRPRVCFRKSGPVTVVVLPRVLPREADLAAALRPLPGVGGSAEVDPPAFGDRSSTGGPSSSAAPAVALFATLLVPGRLAVHKQPCEGRPRTEYAKTFFLHSEPFMFAYCKATILP